MLHLFKILTVFTFLICISLLSNKLYAQTPDVQYVVGCAESFIIEENRWTCRCCQWIDGQGGNLHDCVNPLCTNPNPGGCPDCVKIIKADPGFPWNYTIEALHNPGTIIKVISFDVIETIPGEYVIEFVPYEEV